MMQSIKKYNKDYSNDKLEEIEYGLEVIYLLITKTIVIVGLSFLFGIAIEMLMMLFFYNLLRMYGFGLHASKSWMCWVSSIIIFLLLPYLAKIIIIGYVYKIIILGLCVINLFLFAPADTHKRPLIKKTRRVKFKYTTFILSLIFSYICLLSKNEMLSNCIIFALIVEGVMVNPLVYKMFKLPYNNYKTYKYSA